MDALSVLFNAMWQDAQRPRRRSSRPNSVSEIAAFARRARHVPRLIYSTVAWRWFARDRVAVSSGPTAGRIVPASSEAHGVHGGAP